MTLPKPSVVIPELPEAHFEKPTTRFRFSRVVEWLEAHAPELVPGLVELQRTIGSNCPRHGALPDPIVMLVSGPNWPEDARVAFACPDCSAPEVREAWELEGPARVASVPAQGGATPPPETIWDCAVCERPMRVETGPVPLCRLCAAAEPHHFHARCETCSPPGWYAAIRGKP